MKQRTKHGMSQTRLYRVWSGMKDRCYNPNCKGYGHYGGRGIVICEEWKDDFLAFYEWAIANGYDESAPRGQYTIERKDNDGPYSPDNCRWATILEQERNKRNNIKVQVGDEVKTLKEACDVLGLNYANEKKAHKRRSEGIRPMEEYNRARKEVVEARAEKLRDIMKEHPDWTNNRLAEELGISKRQVQRIRKLV